MSVTPKADNLRARLNQTLAADVVPARKRVSHLLIHPGSDQDYQQTCEMLREIARKAKYCKRTRRFVALLCEPIKTDVHVTFLVTVPFFGTSDHTNLCEVVLVGNGSDCISRTYLDPGIRLGFVPEELSAEELFRSTA